MYLRLILLMWLCIIMIASSIWLLHYLVLLSLFFFFPLFSPYYYSFPAMERRCKLNEFKIHFRHTSYHLTINNLTGSFLSPLFFVFFFLAFVLLKIFLHLILGISLEEQREKVLLALPCLDVAWKFNCWFDFVYNTGTVSYLWAG